MLLAVTGTFILHAVLRLERVSSNTTGDHPCTLNIESLLSKASIKEGTVGRVSPKPLGKGGEPRPDFRLETIVVDFMTLKGCFSSKDKVP